MRNYDFSYEIRWARPEDWKKAMDMVWDTFMKYEGEDYSSEGIRNFYDFICFRIYNGLVFKKKAVVFNLFLYIVFDFDFSFEFFAV